MSEGPDESYGAGAEAEEGEETSHAADVNAGYDEDTSQPNLGEGTLPGTGDTLDMDR